MNPLSPSYLSLTESPSFQLTPAQEAERRQRQQRVKGLGRPAERPQDSVDAASAALRQRLGKTARGKTGDSADATLVEGPEADSPAQEYERLLAGAELLALGRLPDSDANSNSGSGHEPDTGLSAGSGIGQNPVVGSGAAGSSARAMLDEQFDELFTAGSRLGDNSSEADVAGFIAMLGRMGPMARALPVSAYGRDTASHAAHVDSGFDFLQGYLSKRPLTETQQVSVQQAIVLARAAVHKATRLATVQQRIQLEQAHATLEPQAAAARPASNTRAPGASDAPDAPLLPAGVSDVGGETRRAGPELPQVEELTAGEREAQASLDRARERLERYQSGVDQLAGQLSALPGNAVQQPQLQSMAALRRLTPEISLLRLERAGATGVPDRQALLGSLTGLEQACDRLPVTTVGKQELARSIALEQQRLTRDEEKARQGNELALARSHNARALSDDRHKLDTVLKINTGATG